MASAQLYRSLATIFQVKLSHAAESSESLGLSTSIRKANIKIKEKKLLSCGGLNVTLEIGDRTLQTPMSDFVNTYIGLYQLGGQTPYD